jgi:hypothetical protein
MVSVSTPDPDRFVKTKLLPNSNIVAGWESKDGRIALYVTETASMATIKLTLNDLEYPFINEINSQWKKGKMLSSSVQKHEGHEFFTLTGQGEEEGPTNYITKTVTHIGATNYSASAVGRGVDTRTDPDAETFIDSFKSLLIVPDVTFNSNQEAHPQVGKDPDANWITQLMGSIAAFCVIAAVIAFAIKATIGRTSKEHKSSRRRGRRYDDDDEDDEDEDDRPRNRKKRDDDDDEDRPRKKRRDDDDEDRPRKRKYDRD